MVDQGAFYYSKFHSKLKHAFVANISKWCVIFSTHRTHTQKETKLIATKRPLRKNIPSKREIRGLDATCVGAVNTWVRLQNKQ